MPNRPRNRFEEPLYYNEVAHIFNDTASWITAGISNEQRNQMECDNVQVIQFITDFGKSYVQLDAGDLNSTITIKIGPTQRRTTKIAAIFKNNREKLALQRAVLPMDQGHAPLPLAMCRFEGSSVAKIKEVK